MNDGAFREIFEDIFGDAVELSLVVFVLIDGHGATLRGAFRIQEPAGFQYSIYMNAKQMKSISLGPPACSRRSNAL